MRKPKRPRRNPPPRETGIMMQSSAHNIFAFLYLSCLTCTPAPNSKCTPLEVGTTATILPQSLRAGTICLLSIKLGKIMRRQVSFPSFPEKIHTHKPKQTMQQREVDGGKNLKFLQPKFAGPPTSGPHPPPRHSTKIQKSSVYKNG